MPHKTAAGWPLTSISKIYPSNTNKKWKAQLEKHRKSHKQSSSMDPHASTCWPTSKNLHQLCMDTGCSLEDLLGAIEDRDGWSKRVREIHADSMTWWWWRWYVWVCIYIYIYIYIYTHTHMYTYTYIHIYSSQCLLLSVHFPKSLCFIAKRL